MYTTKCQLSNKYKTSCMKSSDKCCSYKPKKCCTLEPSYGSKCSLYKTKKYCGSNNDSSYSSDSDSSHSDNDNKNRCAEQYNINKFNELSIVRKHENNDFQITQNKPNLENIILPSNGYTDVIADKEEETCSICLINKKCIMFVDCHHIQTCYTCTKTIVKTDTKNCPYCRKLIINVPMFVYL